MKEHIIEDKKMLGYFIEKENIVEEAKKVEKLYEEQTKTYEEKIKNFTNKINKIDSKLKPMVLKESTKIGLGEYDEFQRAYHKDGKIIFEILTPDTIREEYIKRIDEKKKKEKEEKKKENKK